ncbi:copper chaperone PCu(A)C [Flaviflexus salsibiostraticola]|nr:copper chaperone PCu(A)C [Flaviflexus salsibiostraticola]
MEFLRSTIAKEEMMRTYTRGAAVAAAALIALAACSDEEPDAPSAEISIGDAWVKASDEAMTSAFGTLSYDGDEPIAITSVTSTAADRVELHETVMGEDGQMIMQEMSGGFSIEAGGELLLEPGGNHLMLMGLIQPIEPGDVITFAATLDSGDTFTFEATAKEYAGANESYHDSE